MNEHNESPRQATQRFAISNVLVGHCGERLTPDVVDAICAEIVKEMRSGSTAWAFSDVTNAA